MSTYITSVGRASFNGMSVDLYVNKDQSATLRPCSNGHDLPKKAWRKFNSEDAARAFIDQVCGDLDGVQRVRAMLAEFKTAFMSDHERERRAEVLEVLEIEAFTGHSIDQNSGTKFWNDDRLKIAEGIDQERWG